MDKHSENKFMNEKVAEAINEVFNIEKSAVSEGSSPDNIAGWDSFSHLELVVVLEEKFGVKFTTQEIIGMSTAGKISEILRKKGSF